jgi:predicted metal-dependent enzyme (double-stranded beta helix superfamily)
MTDLATTTDGSTERSWRTTASRCMHPSVERGAVPLVETIAAGLAAVASPWELTGDAGAERSYQLLLATEQYDAWLIHWPAGTGLEPHDHGGSAGAFAVVAGTLDEERIRPDGTRARQRIGPGASVSFDPAEIHAVSNRSDGGATSVHVYSPPLGAMSFYRADGDGRLVAVETPG